MDEQSIQYTITNGIQVRTIDILDEHADLKVIDDVQDTLLHVAFKREEPNQARIIQIFEILLDRGLDINAKNIIGRTVLHFAIERRYRYVIDFCIQRNANLEVTDWSGNTLAHFIIKEECRRFHLIVVNRNLVKPENKSSKFIERMMSRGIDFFYRRNKNNQSALYLAIDLNLQHILPILLKHVTDFASIEIDKTPLLCAYLERNRKPDGCTNHETLEPIHSRYYQRRHVYNVIKIILERNKSMSNEVLNKVLYAAFLMDSTFEEIHLILQHISRVDDYVLRAFSDEFHDRGRLWMRDDEMTILRQLVVKGANINQRIKYGETLAFRALDYYPKLEMLRLLQDCGADFSARANNNQTFLHLVSRQKYEPGFIEFLVKEGCNVNDLDNYGGSPLSMACGCGDAEVVEELIEFDADFRFKNDFDRNLLHYAVYNHKTVEVLLKKGLDCNSIDEAGSTPLHLTDSDKVIEVLFNAGAFVDALDEKYRTPLNFAMTASRPIACAKLLMCGANIRETSTFQCALTAFYDHRAINSATSRYVMEHLVKMMAVGLINKISHRDKKSEQQLQVFFKKCQGEVELLKDVFVDDRTSLYKLLHKNPNRRCAYVDNERLKNIVSNVGIKQEFPNYFVLIVGCYNEAKTRKPLLQKATSALKKIVPLNYPDLCIDQIFMYLENMELINFLKANENIGKLIMP